MQAADTQSSCGRLISGALYDKARGKAMRKIAVYGKGGIGKSTICGALSAACADRGLKVMQIGCDPKADSCISLLGGRQAVSVMDLLREGKKSITLEDVVNEGYKGCLCIEAGGPTPGIGCAGRGILTAFGLLEDLGAFEQYRPDVVFYDVLGDVVCGGFAAPIREGYAEDVVIVTSGEKMALFAAGNIYTAVEQFKNREYASVRGVILNRRNVRNEEETVRQFAADKNVPVLGDIPRDEVFQDCEDRGVTVIEGAPDSVPAERIRRIADILVQEAE